MHFPLTFLPKNNDQNIYPFIMTNFNETQVLLDIQQLIDRNRCSIDGYFTDSRTAAHDILKYLKNQEIITKNEVAVEIVFNEKNKAA